MKKLLLFLLLFVFSCVTAPPKPDLAVPEEAPVVWEYDYTQEDYAKMVRHLVLLGDIEERPVYLWRTHYVNAYGEHPDGSENRDIFYMFQLTKRTNDPGSGVEVHATKIIYIFDEARKERIVNERLNWIFYDDNIDGIPDRYVKSIWKVENKKLGIEYGDVTYMDDIIDPYYFIYLKKFWNAIVIMLIDQPFDYGTKK